MKVVHGCAAFLPLMRAQGEGHLVNVASHAALTGYFPAGTPYVASKFAVLGLSENLYHELRQAAEPIGIAASWSEFVPCNLQHRVLAQTVRRGVADAGVMNLDSLCGSGRTWRQFLDAQAVPAAPPPGTGPAITLLDGLEDLFTRIDDDSLALTQDSVIVLRGAGPTGGPGMPEVGHLPIPQYAAGGPLALVRDNDLISVDVTAGRIELLVPAAELCSPGQLGPPLPCPDAATPGCTRCT